MAASEVAPWTIEAQSLRVRVQSRPSSRTGTSRCGSYADAVEPLFAIRAGGIRLLTRLLALLLLATVVISAIMLTTLNAVSAASTFVSMVLLLAVILIILPRRYELWPDHLRIVFPLWGWNIHYDDIQTVRPARPFESFGFAGLRFATAPGQAVTILRHNSNMFTHPNLVISPEDREVFLRELERAMSG